MNLLLNEPWPQGVSERQACEVLDPERVNLF